MDTNTTDRRLAAFFHIGAMLLAFFGATPLNILIPLVMMFTIGEKGSPLNNQIREIVRFQLFGAVAIVLMMILTVVLTAATGIALIAVAGVIMTKITIIGYFMMPIIGAIQSLRGKDFTYPCVNSPRRAKANKADGDNDTNA